MQYGDGVRFMTPVVSIVGKSGSGKTTLLEALIPALNRRGYRVGTIKHDVHGFEMDREGKDSYRHKKAGSRVTVISSPRQVGMVRDVDQELTVGQLVRRYFEGVDVILTEGYKQEDYPKVEVHRKILERGLITRPEEGLVAVMSDEKMDLTVPCFSLEDVESLCDFLVRKFHLNR